VKQIIDTHLHLWDLSTFSLPWLSEVEMLDRDFSQADFLREAAKGPDWEIVRAVYVEVDVAPEQREQEAEYIAKLCADNDSLVDAAVISVDMSSPDAANTLRKYEGHPSIRGVRHVLHVPSSPRGACLEDTFITNVQLLGAMGMLFEGCLRTTELSDFVELARKCPGTRMVLDHMGNVAPDIISEQHPNAEQAAYARQWKQDIADLGALDNTCTKISGLNAYGDWTADTLAPSLDYCFDAFGENRIMFASNYPVCQLSLGGKPWIEALMHITANRSEAFQDKLFSLNAARIYNL